MKRKLMIIIVMLLVCTGMFTLAQKAQKSYLSKSNKVSASKDNSADIKKSEESSKKAEINNTAEASKPESKTQQSAVNTTQNKPSNTSTSGNNGNTSSPTQQPTNTPTAVAPAPAPKAMPVPKADSNFVIIDEVNKNIILESKIDFDNVTIDFITCKLLKENNKSYGNEDEGTSVSYFYSINGLAEKKAGPLSGWCFYVNGQRPGIGAGSYIYHRGDVVIWRYKEDSLNK